MYLFKSKADILAHSTMTAFYAFLFNAFFLINILILLPQQHPIFTNNTQSIFISAPLLFSLINLVFWLFSIKTEQQQVKPNNFIFFSLLALGHVLLFHTLELKNWEHLGFFSLTILSGIFSLKTAKQLILSMQFKPVQIAVNLSEASSNILINSLKKQNPNQNIQTETDETVVLNNALVQTICQPIAQENWKILDDLSAKHKYGFFIECISQQTLEKSNENNDFSAPDIHESPNFKTEPFIFYIGWHKGFSLPLLFSINKLPTPYEYAKFIATKNDYLNIKIIEN